MPKKHRKSEENRLFQKTRIQTILDKSPWDSTAIFIFFCYFSVPSLNSSAFSKFSCSSPSPHPIQSWNSEKVLDTRVQHCLWGEGRSWTCVNWKTPQKRRSVPRLLSMIVGLQNLRQNLWKVIRIDFTVRYSLIDSTQINSVCRVGLMEFIDSGHRKMSVVRTGVVSCGLNLAKIYPLFIGTNERNCLFSMGVCIKLVPVECYFTVFN